MPIAPLSIDLEFTRVEQANDPFGFRFAPQEYLLRKHGGIVEKSSLAWDQALLEDLAALRRPGHDPVLHQRVGELIRRFVTPLGWAEYAADILEATRLARRVIVTIRSAAAELYALPWELLTIRETGQHVGELPGVLLRYHWPGAQSSPSSVMPGQDNERILMAWSAAGGAVPVLEHISVIREACQASAFLFEPDHDVLGHMSLGRLQARLAAAKEANQPICILHLLAHGAAAGDTFGLVFEGEDASAGSVIIDAGRLRQVLAPYAEMVRLVVLMACNSGDIGALGNQLGSIAQTLHRIGFESVVASRYPLSIPASVQLSKLLYRELLVQTNSLESALLEARKSLANDTTSFDWFNVQLYSGSIAGSIDFYGTRPLNFHPYKGLAAFGIADHRFFFGREALTEKLWQRFKQLHDQPEGTRLLAIIGPSGAGKSSVAQAGLLARLAKMPLRSLKPMPVVVFKPGDTPFRALEQALSHPLTAKLLTPELERQQLLDNIVRTSQHGSPDGLSRWAATLPDVDDAPLVVLVDQFEEIYTHCTNPVERDAFVSLLLHAASDQSQHVMVVLTLRSDFLGELQWNHPDLNRIVVEQSVLIGAMSREELLQSVATPAERVGRPFDSATIELLLRDAQQWNCPLPVIEFALTLIWNEFVARKLPWETLNAMGGIYRALDSKGGQIFGNLKERERATVQRALVQLAQRSAGILNTPRRVPIRELCGRGETTQIVEKVLRKFAVGHERLVSLSGFRGETVAEVTHEAVFVHWRMLRDWLDQSSGNPGLQDRLGHSPGHLSNNTNIRERLISFSSYFGIGSMVLLFIAALIAIYIYIARSAREPPGLLNRSRSVQAPRATFGCPRKAQWRRSYTT